MWFICIGFERMNRPWKMGKLWMSEVYPYLKRTNRAKVGLVCDPYQLINSFPFKKNFTHSTPFEFIFCIEVWSFDYKMGFGMKLKLKLELDIILLKPERFGFRYEVGERVWDILYFRVYEIKEGIRNFFLWDRYFLFVCF